jgi:hypothetical protein
MQQLLQATQLQCFWRGMCSRACSRFKKGFVSVLHLGQHLKIGAQCLSLQSVLHGLFVG